MDTPLHILIADDDILSRDVMGHVLADRGHDVTMAGDGLQALEGLRREHYDLAILDYHMPLIDGATAARQICEVAVRKGRTRFIGVTADPDGLELRDQGGAIFDAIVQKPLNLPVFVDVVEGCLTRLRQAAAERDILERWQANGFERRPRARLAGRDPDDGTARLGAIFDLSRPGNPDVVLLTEDVQAGDLADLRTTGNLFTLPMVDVSGRWGKLADADCDPAEPSRWSDAAAAAKTFASRRAMLTSRFINATTFQDKLLAYIFVSGRDLSPVACGVDEWTPVYPGFFPVRRVRDVAERLAREGLLFRSVGVPDDGSEPPRFSLASTAIAILTGDDLPEAFPRRAFR